jgi:hypothetical protein
MKLKEFLIRSIAWAIFAACLVALSLRFAGVR